MFKLSSVCFIRETYNILSVINKTDFVIFPVAELLNCANNNALFIVDCFCKITRVLLFVYRFKETWIMFKAVNGVLKLTVKNHTVSNNNNGIKYALIVVVMK